MYAIDNIAVPDRLTRAKALRALRQRGPSGISQLVDALRTGSLPVRQRALHALITWNHATDALPALSDLLRHRDTSLRRFAARCIRRLGTSAVGAVTGLIKALTDPDVRVRIDAVAALGRIGTTGAIREAATALSDSSSAVRAAARRALGQAFDGLQQGMNPQPDSPTCPRCGSPMSRSLSRGGLECPSCSSGEPSN